MTTTRTPAHPEPSASGGRVEGPQAFARFRRLRRSQALRDLVRETRQQKGRE